MNLSFRGAVVEAEGTAVLQCKAVTAFLFVLHAEVAVLRVSGITVIGRYYLDGIG